MENFDPNKDNKGEREKANKGIAVALAGALAAASPMHTQDTTKGSGPDSYTMDYGSSYEFSASNDAMLFVETQERMLNGYADKTSTEIWSKLSAAVDAFVAAHPHVEGKTTHAAGNVSTEASYDPLFDLRAAMETSTMQLSALTIGLLFKKIKAVEQNRLEKGQQ